MNFTFDCTQLYCCVKEKDVLKASGRSENFIKKGNTQSKNIPLGYGIFKRNVVVFY